MGNMESMDENLRTDPSPKICPGCHAANKPIAVFCSKCGKKFESVKSEPVTWTCTGCNSQIRADVKFCRFCGTKRTDMSTAPVVPIQLGKSALFINQYAASGQPLQSQPANEDLAANTVIKAPSEKAYFEKCLEQGFYDANESRTYKSDMEFARILNPLNQRKYDEAIREGARLLPRYLDFDLVYKWIASAYRSLGQYELSMKILKEGLAKAKRKSIILTDLGESEWRTGNLSDAVYWWSQALHCLHINPVDYNAYLLLGYVAQGRGMGDAPMFFNRVDSMVSGQVRLDMTTSDMLLQLVRAKGSQEMDQVVTELISRYLINR